MRSGQSKKEEDFAKLERNDMMLQWMSNVTLKDRKLIEVEIPPRVGKHKLHKSG